MAREGLHVSPVSASNKSVMTLPFSYPENRLRATAVNERPQERMEQYGVGALSDTELLAMLLRSGTRGMDVMRLAGELINTAGSLAGLIGWQENDFRRFKGIGHIKAMQLVAFTDIARRVRKQEHGEAPLLNRPDLIYAYLQPIAQGLAVEKFWVLNLNRKNRLIKCTEISSGTATSALAHPREVFREAMSAAATAVVCAHNHPSGDPAPSAADVQITRQLREAAKTVDIQLLDHIIIGRPEADPAGRGYHSFRETGVL
jgi:DNA repair protein RadC